MNDLSLPPRAEAGVVIGGYELVRRIGRGGMAEVWVARKALGRKGTKFVAIKLLADHYVGDERYTRMFRAEAELAAVLSHANIVQVFDEGEEFGRSYLIMEWVDGLNLLKLGAVLALIDDEQRRFRVAAYIIGQLLYALGYAHSITSFDGSPLGVVHRDVSPQNVLVSNHGEVKLTDFGVAYHVMEESSGIHVKGKVRYMSPEQLSGKTRHPTVDLYAVGALLHELLDGKKFRGDFEDGQDMFSAVLSGAIPPLTRPIPPELDELRMRLLAPDPADRVQSAEEAISMLRRYPGYGDARSELTKLCGSLTGIVRPRAGPGQSSQVPMAEKNTTQFKGRQGLAKPRIASPVGRAGTGRPPGASVQTTIPRKLSPAPPPIQPPPRPVARALITGETQFVTPQAPRPTGAPTRVAGHSSNPIPTPQPAPGQVQPSYPIPVSPPAPAIPSGMLAQQSHPIPVGPPPQAIPSSTPAQSSHPIPVGPPPQAVPSSTPAQSSHPIPIDVSAHPDAEISGPGSSSGVAAIAMDGPGSSTLPPTERLIRSETSGASAVPGGTEVIDPREAIMLANRGGWTDRDILPITADGEGTDTSRDAYPRGPTRSQSTIAIPVQKRSVVAIFVVGLMMIAGLSVGVTWYVVTHREGAPPRVAQQDAGDPNAGADGEAVAAADGEAPGVRDESSVEPAAEILGGIEEAGGVEGAEPTQEAAAKPEEEHGESTAEPEPEPGAPVVEVEAPPEAEPEAPSGPKRERPPRLKIQKLPGTESYQLLIDSRAVTVGSGTTIKVSPGKLSIQWRKGASGPWKAGPSVTMKAGRMRKLVVTTAGPRLI